MKEFEIPNAEISEDIEVNECDVAFFDEEETYNNCTVIVWRNSETGEESIGWYENVGDNPESGDDE